MNKNEQPFEATANNLKAIAMFKQGRAGYVIPEYQRPYAWSEEDIHRLFSDALTGFARLNDSSSKVNASDYTFLGSIILVKSRPHDADFEGESYLVVDGQQRLTTLALIACSLGVKLRKERAKLDDTLITNGETLSWLVKEIDYMTAGLNECAVGTQRVGVKEIYPFPRIVRAGGAERGDERGSSDHTSLYVSAIGKFMSKFSKYIEEESEDNPGKDFELPDFKPTSEAAKIKKNYGYICDLVDRINDPEWYRDHDFEQLRMQSISKVKYRDLFNQLSKNFKDQSKIDRTLSEIVQNRDIETLVRTLLFSSYFYTYIVLTQIETEDESAAFDIFDSLNTTGQPLTALETLKPRVVSYEKDYGEKQDYAGSDSEFAFKKISDNIDEKYPADTSRKQTVTKELIVSFALYLEGRKLAKDLTSQRQFLTKAYSVVTDQKKSKRSIAHRFVNEIANLSEFRYHYFDSKDKYSDRSQFHSTNSRKSEAQLLSSFISSMNTSLAIPTLFRYWTFKNGKLSNEEQFIDVLKATVAFILLRRAATGTTANIDADFRSLMSSDKVLNTDLSSGNCVGTLFNRDALSLSELKSAYRQFLKKRIRNFEKEEWVSLVSENPLYGYSQPLVKFMILIAAHDSMPSTKASGTWTREGARSGANDFYTYEKWIADEYSTVEHIAPDKAKSPGWDESLYSDDVIRHKLGNLILLPMRENSAMGNQGWEKKILFYRAASSKNTKELQKYLSEARNNGIELPARTEKLLKNGRWLDILEPLTKLKTYDRDVVEARTKNIAELCWDFVRPWLD